MVTTMQRASATERGTTPSLIASDRVEGTAVYDAQGKRIGKIEHLVIDKFRGRVIYAVLSFGGFLGIGANHYPIPWQMLDFDEKLGGYRVGITEQQLKNAPKTDQGESWEQATATATKRSMAIGSNPQQTRLRLSYLATASKECRSLTYTASASVKSSA